jgi:hypothetical protein
MNAKILIATVGAALTLAPYTFAQDTPKPSPTAKKSDSTMGTEGASPNRSSDMQAAIAWERHKDAVAARWAQIEAKHPTATNNNNANRTADDADPKVKDPGAKRNK